MSTSAAFGVTPGAWAEAFPQAVRPNPSFAPSLPLDGGYGVPPNAMGWAPICGARLPALNPAMPGPMQMALPAGRHSAQEQAELLRFVATLHQEGCGHLALAGGGAPPVSHLIAEMMRTGLPVEFGSGGTRGAAWVEHHDGNPHLTFDLQSANGLSVTHMVRLHDLRMDATPAALMNQMAQLHDGLQASAEGSAMGLAVACPDGLGLSGAALGLFREYQGYRTVQDLVNGQGAHSLGSGQQLAAQAMDLNGAYSRFRTFCGLGQDLRGPGFAQNAGDTVGPMLNHLHQALRKTLAPWMPGLQASAAAPGEGAPSVPPATFGPAQSMPAPKHGGPGPASPIAQPGRLYPSLPEAPSQASGETARNGQANATSEAPVRSAPPPPPPIRTAPPPRAPAAHGKPAAAQRPASPDEPAASRPPPSAQHDRSARSATGAATVLPASAKRRPAPQPPKENAGVPRKPARPASPSGPLGGAKPGGRPLPDVPGEIPKAPTVGDIFDMMTPGPLSAKEKPPVDTATIPSGPAQSASEDDAVETLMAQLATTPLAGDASMAQVRKGSVQTTDGNDGVDDLLDDLDLPDYPAPLPPSNHGRPGSLSASDAEGAPEGEVELKDLPEANFPAPPPLASADLQADDPPPYWQVKDALPGGAPPAVAEEPLYYDPIDLPLAADRPLVGKLPEAYVDEPIYAEIDVSRAGKPASRPPAAPDTPPPPYSARVVSGKEHVGLEPPVFGEKEAAARMAEALNLTNAAILKESGRDAVAVLSERAPMINRLKGLFGGTADAKDRNEKLVVLAEGQLAGVVMQLRDEFDDQAPDASSPEIAAEREAFVQYQLVAALRNELNQLPPSGRKRMLDRIKDDAGPVQVLRAQASTLARIRMGGKYPAREELLDSATFGLRSLALALETLA